MLVVTSAIEPSPEDARSSVRRELLKPEYHETDPIGRLLDWLDRVLGDGIEAASGLSSFSTFAVMLIAVVLIGALIWLISRTRAAPRQPKTAEVLFADEILSAAQLRASAETALRERRYSDALVDGFRALAARQIERGRLDISPGTTAREAATALGAEFPGERSHMEATAALFDAVLYGGRTAEREQAVAVLAIDDSLKAAR